MIFTVSLKKNHQFRTVYSQGKSCADRLLVLYVLKNSGGTNRLGISVSKKVGCSVVRSRVTRLIRESYRTLESGVIAGSDLVFIARSGARSAVFADIKSSVNNLLKKQHIMAEAEP